MISQQKNYKGKFLLATLFGYSYIFFILFSIIGLCVLLIILAASSHGGYAVAGKLTIILFVLCWVILKAIWIDIKPPQGRDFLPLEAPKLFKLINQMRKDYKVPPIHKIKLTTDLNASIVQHPRLGVFGFYQNYLILGLPLMQTLSVEQFKGVLAHEMCHISRKHGQFGMWSYRMIGVWQKLSEIFEGGGGWINFVFKPFFKKFVPFYRKLSFAFQQQHEFESDNFEAKATSASNTAKTLIRLEIMSAAANKYWKDLDKTAQSQDFPPKEIYAGYIAHMRKSFALEDVSEILHNAFLRQTLDFDTHPSLTDRLKAVGYAFIDSKVVNQQGDILDFKEEIVISAAEEFIDKALLKQWNDEIVKMWDEDNKAHWYKLREQYHLDIKRVNELVEKENQGLVLNKDEYWERARIYDALFDEDKAIADLRKCIEINHEVGSAKLILGKILLNRKDYAGVQLIEEGIKLEPHFESWGANCLVGYFEKIGNVEQLRQWYDKLIAFDEKSRLSDLERQKVLTTDKFKEHEASEDVVKDICKRLEDVPEVSKAYLVSKKLEYYTHRPVYLLSIKIKFKFFANSDYYKEFEQYFLRQTWKNDVFISVQNSDFINKVKKIPNALIYQHKGAK